VQLVTDARTNDWNDAAEWADLILSPSSGTCSYSVPTQTAVAFGGATANVAVTTTAACPWAASSSVPWITVNTPWGVGSGNVSYIVTQNTGAPRTGTLVVGGQNFLIKQADSAGNFP